MGFDQKITTQNQKMGKRTRLRWWFAILFFIIGIISYMDRANLAIVAEPMMRDIGMSKIQFGFLGSCFSLGYALTQIPAGILAERFGSRKIITLALSIWSFFTILTAIVSNYIWLCAIRFLFGMGEAPIFPANAVFNTYWFRRTEKARAVALLTAGTYFGPVVAPLLTVAIMVHFSWHMVFYIFGAIGLIVAVFWHVFARNRPEEHPFISKEELDYIKDERTIDARGEQISAPWRQFFYRLDFWAIGLHYFFVVYMTALFLIWLPTFLQEARGFSLTHMGIAASFPWLAICAAVLGGGVLSDKLLEKGYSSFIARGLPSILGLIGFIIGILGTAYSANQFITVFWLSVTLGSLGFTVVGSWAVVADKGRQYAGSVGGWMNLWGNIGGTVSPLLCGVLAQYFGWTIALLFNIIPIVLAMFCWFYIKADKPMVLPKS